MVMSDVELTLSEILTKLDAVLEILRAKDRGTPPEVLAKPAYRELQTPDGIVPQCQYCGGPMWDNSKDKRNPKYPDYKCKSKECGGAAWINTDNTFYWKKGLPPKR